MASLVHRTLALIASKQAFRLGIAAMKVAIAIIFIWIGALKFVPYEADSITPFVANSPILHFFYAHPEDYKAHMTHEGELRPEAREWQKLNNTYGFSTGLGIVEVTIGCIVLLGLFSTRLALLGAALALATPFVTLSFLVTTPEAWVPALGDAEHGVPYLSGAGRLIVKDVALLAGAWLLLVDAARSVVGLPASSLADR